VQVRSSGATMKWYFEPQSCSWRKPVSNSQGTIGSIFNWFWNTYPNKKGFDNEISGFELRTCPLGDACAGAIDRRKDRREFGLRRGANDGGLREGGAISDMFEIRSSQLAQERGSASEKPFAEMIKDHQKTSDEIKAMVSSDAVKAELPTALDSSHQSSLDKLKSLKGSDFSSRYSSDQVSGHKDVVSLFERYAKGGENAKLKEWADKTLPTLRHHLEMAQDLAAGKTVGRH
jgi:putative membrane protein